MKKYYTFLYHKMYYYIQRGDVSFEVDAKAVLSFIKDNVLVKITKTKEDPFSKVYLTRFSTIKQAETFLTHQEDISSLLESYDAVMLSVESLHVSQVSTYIDFMKAHQQTLFHIPTVDRLLKTNDVSLIDLPTNIVFINEESHLTYPVNEEQIITCAKEAREQSDLLSKQAKKRLGKRRSARKQSPRRKYLSFQMGKEIAAIKNMPIKYIQQHKDWLRTINYNVSTINTAKASLMRLTNEIEDVERTIVAKTMDVDALSSKIDMEAANIPSHIMDGYKTYEELIKM